MVDMSLAYTEVQERLCSALEDLAEARADTPVPACPGWSVRDVVAHHCGAVVDVVTGNDPEFFGGFNLLDQWRDDDVARARDDLTSRQVAEREGRSLRSLVREWREATAALLPIMRGEQPFPEPVPSIFGGILINDAVVHEGDIRFAVGLDRAPAGAALSLALLGYGFSLDYRIRTLGLPPLVLAYDGKTRQVGGEGDPGATVSATRFDLVRTLASRRTAAEILSLDWSGNPEPYVPILPEYGPVRTSTGG
jgi:uncharacterized protein (TIGR03083 family)